MRRLQLQISPSTQKKQKIIIIIKLANVFKSIQKPSIFRQLRSGMYIYIIKQAGKYKTNKNQRINIRITHNSHISSISG